MLNLSISGGGLVSYMITYTLFDYYSNNSNKNYYKFMNENIRNISSNSGGSWFSNALFENRLEYGGQIDFINNYINNSKNASKEVQFIINNNLSLVLRDYLLVNLNTNEEQRDIIKNFNWIDLVNYINNVNNINNEIINITSKWNITNSILSNGNYNDNSVYYIKDAPFILPYFTTVYNNIIENMDVPYFNKINKNNLEYNIVCKKNIKRNKENYNLNKDKLIVALIEYNEKIKDNNTSCALALLSSFNRNIVCFDFLGNYIIKLLLNSVIDNKYLVIIGALVGIIVGILAGGFTSKKENRNNKFGFGAGIGAYAGLIIGSTLFKSSKKCLIESINILINTINSNIFNRNLCADLRITDKILLNGADGGYYDGPSLIGILKLIQTQNLNNQKIILNINRITKFTSPFEINKKVKEYYEKNLNEIILSVDPTIDKVFNNNNNNNNETNKLLGGDYQIFKLLDMKLGKLYEKNNVQIRIDNYKFETINNDVYGIKSGTNIELKLITTVFINLAEIINIDNKDEYIENIKDLKYIIDTNSEIKDNLENL